MPQGQESNNSGMASLTAVFSRDEVAKHNADDSNWIIIDDKVSMSCRVCTSRSFVHDSAASVSFVFRHVES